MKRVATCLIIVCVSLLNPAWPRTAEAATPVAPETLGYEDVEVVATHDYYTAFEDEITRTWRDSEVCLAYGSPENYSRDVSIQGLQRSFRTLMELAEASGDFDVGPNGELLRVALLNELGAVLTSLEAPGVTALAVVNMRFNSETSTDDPVRSQMIFFAGPPNQIVLRMETVGSGESTLSSFQPAAGWKHYATINQAIAVRTVTTIVEDIFAQVRARPYELVTARLSANARAWTNYLENGYSQYPWELVVNRFVAPRLFGRYSWHNPPKGQLVLLHPELCSLVDIRTRREASAQSALLVHGLGCIRYFGSEREWFVGLSASGCFAGDEFGLAYGPTLHIDHVKFGSQVPHISFGVLWFDTDDGRDGPLITVAVDFWRILNKEGAWEYFLPLVE